jgi:hypothetical protein
MGLNEERGYLSFLVLPRLSATCHRRNRLEQGIAYYLAGLLAVGALRHRSCGHQSRQRGLEVILALLFGIHEGHTSIH